MASPNVRITISTFKFVTLVFVVLSLAEGTWRDGRVWAFTLLQLVGMLLTNAWLMRNDPALLRRRLVLEERGETVPVQRRLMSANYVLGLATLVTCGLDRRFAWSHVPMTASITACAFFGFGMAIVFLVFRTNTFTSSVIEVAETQTVVRAGPYRFVRHPMYSGALVMGLAMPIALGSLWGELLIVPSFVVLALRIRNEESFLEQNLDGYREYLRETPRRLVPGVW